MIGLFQLLVCKFDKEADPSSAFDPGRFEFILFSPDVTTRLCLTYKLPLCLSAPPVLVGLSSHHVRRRCLLAFRLSPSGLSLWYSDVSSRGAYRGIWSRQAAVQSQFLLFRYIVRHQMTCDLARIVFASFKWHGHWLDAFWAKKNLFRRMGPHRIHRMDLSINWDCSLWRRGGDSVIQLNFWPPLTTTTLQLDIKDVRKIKNSTSTSVNYVHVFCCRT